MSLPFLLEIGTEEIPDWMIEGALQDMQALFERFLAIPLQSPTTVAATPRRLVLRAQRLPEKLGDLRKKVGGPKVGAPQAAVEGFARKQNVAPADLQQENGYYVFEKVTPGRSMRDILTEEIPSMIRMINFPKTMYWTSDKSPRFIRPIRWIVALLGGEVIPFEIAGVKSGNLTAGHRILGTGKIAVTIANYENELEKNFVILSANDRAERIHKGVGAVQDEGLLKTLVYLTEYPTVISGNFDPEYLKLPAEVLVTVMKHHQKYFAVYENGQLTNRFHAVINTDGDPEGIIRRGNERVLRARFNDAKFFWDTDRRKKLEDRILELEHVTFHAQLGSYRQKAQLVTDWVRDRLRGDAAAVRAAYLCKSDLTTELVKEFTELQGVVGGLYAREEGEPEEVWTAIYDHYKPVSMEDSIPRNRGGQLVSVADRLDTLNRCFSIGLIPTGSKDPFALRRAAQGIVKIAVEGKLRLPIRELLDKQAKLEEFFLDRIRYYFKDIRGFKYDEVNAVLASGWDDLVDVEERLVAIQAVRPTENFEPLAASFKRIRNILRQAQFTGGDWPSDVTFSHPAEEELYRGFEVAKAQVDEYRRNRSYRSALETIAGLRPKVDRFFDEVLVNDPDQGKRQLRLKLLHDALENFSTIADFSEIVTNG